MIDRNAELPRNRLIEVQQELRDKNRLSPHSDSSGQRLWNAMFGIFPSDANIEVDPEKLLNDPFTRGFIPRPEDPDFDAFCEYIGRNKPSDTHS